MTEAPTSPHPESGCVASLRGVHFGPERAFTINRIGCSQSFGLSVHIHRNLQAGALGAVHARFIARLKANANRIVWWDYSTPKIHLALTGLTLVRAQGPRRDRNESGLAVRVEGRRGGVLLPGDASLKNLRKQCHSLEHLMVPHHGGRTDLSFVPVPVHQSTSRIIYSYGVGNLYRHPIDGTMRALSSSWKKNTHTALRDGTGLGHVGIRLTNRGLSNFNLPCGRNCQLEIRQWI